MMKQNLSLQQIMTTLRKRWSTARDERKSGNRTQYKIADGVLAAFAVFFMQSSSFLSIRVCFKWKKYQATHKFGTW
jgi:hypothetical protein